jgi:peptide deformylase
MALLPILKYPDPRLHKIAKPVEVVDDRVRQIVSDMAETMYDADGIGLAATQVDIHERIVVMDISEERNDLLVLINPKIVERSDDKTIFEEGCLSVPGIYDKVERSTEVTVEAQNIDGETFRLEADGLLAICIQHELDHLVGKVFVEHLSNLKQNRIRTKIQKAAREAKREAQRV